MLFFDLLKHQPLKHFVPTGVRVMGLKSLRLLMVEFLESGVMVADLRQGGTAARVTGRDRSFHVCPFHFVHSESLRD